MELIHRSISIGFLTFFFLPYSIFDTAGKGALVVVGSVLFAVPGTHIVYSPIIVAILLIIIVAILPEFGHVALQSVRGTNGIIGTVCKG